ncbi:MAG: M23 family metallopeptidase, partial [Treponema sp.]|nr:M23 family metallopeptidase [Treponema sp.]
QIGNVGSTGAVTGPHLHFEIRKNGIATNPFDFIKK